MQTARFFFLSFVDISRKLVAKKGVSVREEREQVRKMAETREGEGKGRLEFRGKKWRRGCCWIFIAAPRERLAYEEFPARGWSKSCTKSYSCFLPAIFDFRYERRRGERRCSVTLTVKKRREGKRKTNTQSLASTHLGRISRLRIALNTFFMDSLIN